MTRRATTLPLTTPPLATPLRLRQEGQALASGPTAAYTKGGCRNAGLRAGGEPGVARPGPPIPAERPAPEGPEGRPHTPCGTALGVSTLTGHPFGAASSLVPSPSLSSFNARERPICEDVRD